MVGARFERPKVERVDDHAVTPEGGGKAPRMESSRGT